MMLKKGSNKSRSGNKIKRIHGQSARFIYKFPSLLIIILILILLTQVSSDRSLPFTSRGYRYSAQFNNTCKKYPALKKLNSKGTFPIPGLARTDVLGESCRTMTPQGITAAGSYILVTAYDRNHKFLSDLKKLLFVPVNLLRYASYKQNDEYRSVIYVIDKRTGRYRTTLVLPDKNHVGGITYDGSRVWVAKSSDYELSCIDMNTINKAVSKHKDSVFVDYDHTVVCDRMASFVTYFDNRLWVGFCNANEKGTGVMDGFEISLSKKGKPVLTSSKEISIPYNANGAVFAKAEGKTCLAVSVSNGRGSRHKKCNSRICLYELDLKSNSDIAGFKTKKSYKMPPMMEEMCLSGRKLYFIFESGSSAYSKVALYKCHSIVDRICIGKVSDLFYWTKSDYVDPFEKIIVNTNAGGETAASSVDVPVFAYQTANGPLNPDQVGMPDTLQEISSDTSIKPYQTKTQASPLNIRMLFNPYQACMQAYPYNIRMLFNTYQADMLADIACETSNRRSESYFTDRLSSYGYMQLYRTGRLRRSTICTYMGETGSAKYIKASVSAYLGVKKLMIGGRIKYNIIIDFVGNDLASSIRGAAGKPLRIKYDKAGRNTGFRNISDSFYSKLSDIDFLINRKHTTLKTILNDMKDPDSRYSMIVTGYGAGGAVADMFTADHLFIGTAEKLSSGSNASDAEDINEEAPERGSGSELFGVYPGNILTMTFGAYASWLSEKHKAASICPYGSIINVSTSDDYARSMKGAYLLKQSGGFKDQQKYFKDIRKNKKKNVRPLMLYKPDSVCQSVAPGNTLSYPTDLSFRRYHYDNDPYSGQSSVWFTTYKGACLTSFTASRPEIYRDLTSYLHPFARRLTAYIYE
jgi:hypothetical protein